MDATGIMNLQENDTSVSLSYRRSCVLGSYYQGDTRVGSLQEWGVHVCHLLLYVD